MKGFRENPLNDSDSGVMTDQSISCYSGSEGRHKHNNSKIKGLYEWKEKMVNAQLEAKKEVDIDMKKLDDYGEIRKDIFRIHINNALFYKKLGKYNKVMDLFQQIGFRKVSNQLNTAFNFIRDPGNTAEQEELWRQNDIQILDLTCDSDSRSKVKSRDLMIEFNTNNKGISDAIADKNRAEGNFSRLSSTMMYLEISKSDISLIYTVKEAYMMIKHLVNCCDV